MKDCSTRSDVFAKSEGWSKGQRYLNVHRDNGDTVEISISDWRNHYSPKYQRCYLLVYFTHFIRHANGKSEAAVPLNTTALYDPFEGTEIARCESVGKDPRFSPHSALWCSAPRDGAGPDIEPFNCSACKKFIEERMDIDAK
jgi:hypothetical protein